MTTKLSILTSLIQSNENIKKVCDDVSSAVKEILAQEIKTDTSSIVDSLAKEMPEIADWLKDTQLNEDIMMEIKKSHWNIKEHIKKCVFKF